MTAGPASANVRPVDRQRATLLVLGFCERNPQFIDEALTQVTDDPYPAAAAGIIGALGEQCAVLADRLLPPDLAERSARVQMRRALLQYVNEQAAQATTDGTDNDDIA